MEKLEDLEQRNLINELMQGKELAKQLLFLLNTPSSSLEARELLLQRILASYEKALSILNSNTIAAVEPPIRAVESPPSPRCGSPRSEDSDRDVKDQELKDSTPKKRKTLPKWTQRVRMTPGSPLEVRLHDGFSWRKYGQKDILGARYPRGYYRCTHRNVQGCLATKHVQRSDEEPMIFEVTYRGRHTCAQAASSSQIPPSSSSDDTSVTLYNQTNQQQQVQTLQDNLLINYQKSLRVVTENLDIVSHQQQPYTFSSTSYVKPENAVFSSPVMENNMMGSFSPHFFSPAASSGANYFPVSTTPSGVQGNMNFQSSSASAAASATNSPTVGLGFPFGDVGFGDPNFTFDDPGFFS